MRQPFSTDSNDFVEDRKQLLRKRHLCFIPFGALELGGKEWS